MKFRSILAAIILAALTISAPVFATGFDFRTVGTTSGTYYDFRVAPSLPAVSQVGRSLIVMDPACGCLKLSENGGAWVTLWSPGGGGGGVSAFAGRTGSVIPVAGDYNATQVNATPFGPITGTTVQTQLSQLNSKIDAQGGVTSWKTRTGAVTPQTGDYVASQVTSSATGDVASTDVQAAIAELASEKVNAATVSSISGPKTFTATPSTPITTRPSSAPPANAKQIDVQDSGGITKASIDYEGDAVVHDESVTGALSVTGTSSFTGAVTSDLMVSRANAASIVAVTAKNTATAGGSVGRLVAASGDGTTSAEQAYTLYQALENVPQNWLTGMIGSKSWKVQDLTAGQDRLVIDTSGSVGIGGTPDASAKLHLFGKQIVQYGSGGVVPNLTANTSYFWNTGINGGIDLARDNAAGANLVNGDIVGVVGWVGRAGGLYVRTARIDGIYTGNGTTQSGDLSFLTANAGAPAERMRLSALGALGIGRAPDASLVSGSLHVGGISGGAYAQMMLGSDASNYGTLFRRDISGSNFYADIFISAHPSANASTLRIFTGPSASTPALTIDPSGNVGIGVAPYSAAPLDVKTGSASRIYFSQTGGGIARIQGVDAGNTVAKDIAINDGGGRVGIGAAPKPTAKLGVYSGEAFIDFSTGGATDGGALRLASNAAQAFIASNAYFSSTVKYARTGGSGAISLDIGTGATAGDISVTTAPSGTADTTQTQTEVLRIKQNGNAIHSGSITERNRATAMGEWTTFTPTLGAQAGTFSGCTFNAARYMLVGKTMTINLTMTLCNVSTTPTYLLVNIPGGFTSNSLAESTYGFSDNGTAGIGVYQVQGVGGTQVVFYKNTNGTGAWSASTTNTTIAATVILEIQ